MDYNITFVFEAIGTKWEIDINSSLDKKILLSKVKKRIDEFDKNYSRFRKDSLVYTIYKNGGTYEMPQDFSLLFSVYKNLYKKTHGLFTPLIGNVMRDAGYDENYSFKKKTLHKPQSLEKVITYKNNKISINKGNMLDFGAGGKGYLIDIVGELLKKEGVSRFCIDAGADILFFSDTKENNRVGLENPTNTRQVIGVAEVSNKSICGSAGNRRSWKNFHHIINPETLNASRSVLATWVIADTALVADALATALFLLPQKKVVESFFCEYLILFEDMSIEVSENFNAELFLRQ